MKMSKKQKLNDAEIYLTILDMITEVEDVEEITVLDVPDIASALARLEMSVKYRMFDYEATLREREHLIKLLEGNGKK